MAGPVDPRLLRRARATRAYLVAGVGVGCTTAILTIVQAWLLSFSLADVFATHTVATVPMAAAGLAAVFAAKGLLAWANQWLANRTSAAVKSQLRMDVLRARVSRPVDPDANTGGLITLVTQGLDALDGYYAKYLPQLLLAATVPFIVGVAILTSDWLSAVIVALCLPLIPVFMALVGWMTEARTKKRWRTQTRLANHFADLVLGLPTLQVFGRAKAQAAGLRKSEDANRRETMGTLRISFLSAMVLELLATLSVAVVAVTIGFRVVAGDVDLRTALFVLILAPEAFLPVRQVGVHFHDSQDGIAAADAAFTIIDGPAGRSPAPVPPATAGTVVTTESPAGSHRAFTLEVDGLGHRYAADGEPALRGLDLEIAPGEIVALTGPSGGGKTTALNAVMGFLEPTEGQILVDGRPLAQRDLTEWRTHVAWVGQNPGMIAGTVADNVRLGYPQATDLACREALDTAGGADIPLAQSVGDDGVGVSAGERRRIAMARALLRITMGRAKLLLLDEPTAGLDADSEATLLQGLRRLGTSALIVSHRPAVIAEADRVVEVTA